MRSVLTLIYIFLFALSGTAPAFCYGAVALGYNNAIQDYIVVFDEPSASVAGSKALELCRARLNRCRIGLEFSDKWISVVTSAVTSINYSAIGDSPEEAQDNATKLCKLWDSNCGKLAPIWKDGTPIQAQRQPASTSNTSQTGEPRSSVDSPAPIASASSLNRFVEFASSDVRQFISEYDLHWITLVAATAAVCLFVGTQLYSVIRTGRRRLRDIAFNALRAVLLVFAGTLICFVSAYTGTRLAAFGSTLTPAGRLLLFSSLIGTFLLTIPHFFWRALGKIFSGPRAPVPAGEQPPAPPQTSSFEETRSQSPSDDERTGNVVSMVQPQAPEINVSGDASPRQPIVLRLKRSQKPAMRGMIYMLDAQIDLSAEVQSLITMHKLGSRVIYESEARQRHAENARGHLDNSRSDTPIFASAGDQAKGIGRTLWGLAKAGVSAARASLALRITVSSLMAGVHVECKSMEELLEAESAIREARENLESQIAAIQSFDGSEEVI
jgi:Domain of unknown function (DUF4189)